MERSKVSQALAEGFWYGRLPTDLPDDYLDALEMTAMGPAGYEELGFLVQAWELGSVTPEDLVAQAQSLGESFREAVAKVSRVARPEHHAVRDLLYAIREALFAMAEACSAVAASVEAMHGGTLREAMQGAEKAAAVLDEIYDGTHFEG